MNYGYFDNEPREYVITRPDTPSPWINFLGNGEYGGFISNNAGGMSYHKDPNSRRITRYKYNNLPFDRPGRYIYLRDMETDEYWSPSWQPVMKKLDEYECRHGLGYTIIKGVYSGIEAHTTYFVPVGKDYEIWKMRIKNNTSKERHLKVFTYVEFSYPHASLDLMCDWPRMLFNADCNDSVILFEAMTDAFYPYISINMEVEGYDCSLEKFIGAYRSESNPIAVENGFCTNSDISSENAVGGLCCPLKLAAGEEKTIAVVLGFSENKETAKDESKKNLNLNIIEKDFGELKEYWNRYLSKIRFTTPDKEVNLMLNTWNQYQCKTTFDWSRFISLYERGIDRGLGFRDSMQDVLGVVHAIPEKVKQRIVDLLSIQNKRGDAMSVLYPATKKAQGGGRSDDHIWSVFSVCNYIKETGDIDFLNEMVPFYDGGEGTVLEHLENSIKFTMNNLGTHGIPLLLLSDWNDTLASINAKGGSESVFVFFQLGHAVYELMYLYRHYGYEEKLEWASEVYDYCKLKLDMVWDGKWFLRAFNSYGEKFGTAEDQYNRIFLNPQSWAVLSRLPSREQAVSALDAVRENLKTDLGLITHFPAPNFYDTERKAYMPCAAGTKENGGIFYHANTWAIIAETILGRNEYAFEYYRNTLPCKRNYIADVCKIEPYVYASHIFGKQHPRFGEGTNSWLTGTASWM
jgi:cellobiose phosphorylase